MSKNIINRLVFLVSFFAGVNSVAQTNRINFLRDELAQTKDPVEKIELILDICEQHNSFSTDTLLHYYQLAKNISDRSDEQKIETENYYSIYLAKTGNTKEAIRHCDSLLNMITPQMTRKVFREVMITKCGALIRNNETKGAIENIFELLKSAESAKDTVYILKSYTMLGWANMEIEKYAEASVWLNKGIAFTKDENLLQQTSALFANNASCYNNLNKDDSALYFVNKSLVLAKKAENLAGICNALNIRAYINLKKDYFAFAESDMYEALAVREKIGDPYYIIADMGSLATYYAMRKIPEKGIPIALKGVELARKTRNIPKIIYLYQTLAENYRVSGKTEEQADVLVKIIDLKDSLYRENSEDALAVFQTRYEVQKKENTILQQKLKLERNTYFLIGSSLIFVLICLVVILLYRNYKHVQKIKMEEMLREQKILSGQAVLKAEEAERKRIAADLHDNLGSYAAAISANTKNIKEGNTDRLETLAQLDENAQNMVIQLSDTIWVLKNEQLPFTSLSDRFKSWMQKLMKNYPEAKYYFHENIKQDLIFSPSSMLHLFLIMKECVTNILKHSGADKIEVNFYCDKDWKIEIIDNGKGFDTYNFVKGSGIENIRHRVSESGWQLDMKSKPNEGTTVTITGNTTK